MVRKIILVIIITLVCASQSFAFDGVRKGFTMGLGAGYSPYANPNLQNIPGDYSFAGFGMNLLLGYNWDNKNLLAWEVLGAINIQERSNDNDAGLVGYNGITWYHYLKPTQKSYYTILGIGRVLAVSVIQNSDNTSTGYGSTGFGYILGGGYEFAKQLQFSMCYVGGKSSDYSTKSHNSMIYMSVSFVAY